MSSRVLLILRATSPTLKSSLFPKKALLVHKKAAFCRSFCVRSGLEPPNLPRLAETARISLTPHEIEEFAPKIQQVVDWFGQLRGVDLQSVQPSIRAGTEGQNLRDDLPENFENREQMIAAVPNYEDPFIKVPKVLNKE